MTLFSVCKTQVMWSRQLIFSPKMWIYLSRSFIQFYKVFPFFLKKKKKSVLKEAIRWGQASWDSPGGRVLKNLPQWRRCRFPTLGREDPWRRKWHRTPVFLPGKTHGQRSLAGCSPWGHKEPDTAEYHHHTTQLGGHLHQGQAGETQRHVWAQQDEGTACLKSQSQEGWGEHPTERGYQGGAPEPKQGWREQPGARV